MARSTGQVARLLKSEGLHVSVNRLHYGRLVGRIPTIPTDALGNFQWDDVHVEAARQFCSEPPRRGRPPRVNVEGADA